MSAQDRAALVERLKARALQHKLLVEQHIQVAKRFDDSARAAKHAAQADYYANRADSYRRQSEGPAAEAAMLREAVAALATPPTEREAVRVLEELRQELLHRIDIGINPTLDLGQMLESIDAKLAALRRGPAITTPIVVTECRRTCNACPSQWEGQTADGQHLYARCRWGRLEISLGPTLQGAIEADPVIDVRWGAEYDGFMSDRLLRDITHGRILWQAQP